MNDMQQAYVNNMVTHAATTLTKASTDGDVFKAARNVADEIAQSVDPDEDTQLDLYNVLLEHRNSLE